MLTRLSKEIIVVLTVKLLVLLVIWFLFFYEQDPVIAPLQNLLP